MDLAVIVIFILASAALIVTWIVETLEYRRYRKAAHSVIAFGESMQESFNEVVQHMNRFQTQSIIMAQGLTTQEQDINYLKNVLEIHSEALNLHFNQIDGAKYTKVDGDGTDSVTAVQG